MVLLCLAPPLNKKASTFEILNFQFSQRFLGKYGKYYIRYMSIYLRCCLLTGNPSIGSVRSISPKNSLQYCAIFACCLGLQWFSKERIRGKSEVLKALSAIASITSWKKREKKKKNQEFPKTAQKRRGRIKKGKKTNKNGSLGEDGRMEIIQDHGEKAAIGTYIRNVF